MNAYISMTWLLFSKEEAGEVGLIGESSSFSKVKSTLEEVSM